MSTVEQVQDDVLGTLIRGELAPGTRIRQDALAASLGVSKIPVREALHRLAARGLIRFESNRGAITPTLSAADAEEIFALRRAIEPQLLLQSLPSLSIIDLAEAEHSLKAAELTVTEANWHFHRALYRASAWIRGLSMAEMLHAAVAPYVLLYTDGLGGGDESAAEHRELLEASRSGNGQRAAAILERHLNHASDALQRFLAGSAEDVSPSRSTIVDGG